ncbi:putative secreted protein [Candidatus Protochlamydia naegleriophila]|uniref:Putative secreted protein n=1 Tax=Candidatus Protochlamydia naegleriophila TaxID=389348 RepID=A0A0U5EQX0_9BACT|nr:hypothetical protein [Candidatus Protochlamydia naegleriophila]CUI16560.1 putative secreted protein [Candidatus Protochlamydia naegleriophila]
MRQILSCVCCTIMALNCFADVATDEKTGVAVEPSFCTKEELMTYFPQPLVKAILLKSNVQEEQAAAIAEDLAQKGQELEKVVAEKAAKLDPNPFKDLSQRDVAIKIYRETLYEVFAKVMKNHGITSEDQIQTLLDEMQLAKSKLFIDCIRREQNSPKKVNSPLPPSS